MIAAEPRSFESRKIDLAILEAQDAIRLDPNNWDAYYNLANIYFSQKEYTLAEGLFQKVLDAGNKSYAIYRGMGNVHYAQKKYKEAVKYFEKAVDLRYKDPESHYALAVAYDKLGNDELFVQECTRALVVDKNFARAHYAMGFYYARNEKFDQAIKELEKAVRISPADPEAHFLLMQLYLKKNKVKDSMRECAETLKYDPKHIGAHLQMGAFAEQFEDHVTAVHEFIEVKKLRQDHPGIDERITAALKKEETKCRQEIARAPRSARPYLVLADLYYEAGRLDLAATLCEQVIAFDPKNITARTNLGVIYASVEKYIKAIVEYQKALSYKSDDPQVLANLELACRAGLQYYRAVLEKDPRNVQAWDSLIVIHKVKGDQISLVETYEEKMNTFTRDTKQRDAYAAFGKEYLAQALKAMKVNSQDVYQVGLAYWALGDLASAQRVFQLIVDNHPKDVRALYLLGRTLARQKNYAQALQYLQRSYRLNPSYRDTFNQIKDICTRTVDSLMKKLQGNVGDVPQLVEIAEIYHGQQMYAEALQYLEKVIHYAPADTTYAARFLAVHGDLRDQLERSVAQGSREQADYLQLGQLYEEDALLSKAIAVYEKGLELFPRETVFRERHIRAAEQAIVQFEKYLHKEPHDGEALFALASFAATVGYRLKALDALQRAVKIKTSYADRARNASEFKDLKTDQRFREITNMSGTEGRIDRVVE